MSEKVCDNMEEDRKLHIVFYNANAYLMTHLEEETMKD